MTSSSLSARYLRLAGKSVVVILACIGLIAILIFATSRALDIYVDQTILQSASPSRTYTASVSRTRQAFDEQVLVILRRTDGRGESRTVVTYEVPFPVELDLAWPDDYTLAIATPCEPPTQLRQWYVDDIREPSRRIIVEVQPRRADCRYSRGEGWDSRDTLE